MLLRSKIVTAPSSQRIAGFSLVEIMVGMVMGMLGIIVVMQVFALFEGQKRATSGGSDAQNAGAIALYGIERDVRQSGYGVSAYNVLGCTINPVGGNTITLAPTTINSALVPAGDANTDTLLLVSSNTNSPAEGDTIFDNTLTTYTMTNAASFAQSDVVVAEPTPRPNPCNLTITRVTGYTNPTLTVATGALASSMKKGLLYNLGQTPRIIGYAVRNGSLTTCDYFTTDCATTANWTNIADNIVSLRAEYGHDNLVPAVGTYQARIYDQTSPTNACGWARTPVIRLVLVARNGQYDKSEVTASSSVVTSWAGSATTAIDLVKNPNGTTDTSGAWKHYRYKNFETLVPLRNITSLGVQTGC